eukprot:XP_015572775.1 uncharacterized protein LOC8286577 [Ricinus communis]
MAVETNLGTLLEKLKVEEPWLPPVTWESIPSQNVSSFRPPPNSSPLKHTSSSLSEASLVRLALNAMQGVESALTSIQKLSSAFSSDPADRSHHQIPSLWNRSSSTHALGRILNSIGCFGSLVFLLRKFVDNLTHIELEQIHYDHDTQKEQHLSYTLVNQAFAVAVGKVLEGYVCALNTVYASARLRHSSTVDVEYYEEACLTSIVHSKVTLLELYLHTKELRCQIEALGNICNLYDVALCFSVSSLEDLNAKAVFEFSNFYRGGDLLSYLYTQLQVADPPHRAILNFLFLRSFEPYCGLIRSWIFSAQTSDPYKEFIVECGDKQPPDLHCKAGIPFDFPWASIRDGVAIPCFLKDFLIPIIRAGQQLQVLMKLLELCNYAGPGEHTYEDLLPSFNGYTSDNLFHASPVTFSKGHFEAMVKVRNNYYKKMLEKLGNVLAKLELRYQQVVPDVIVPIYFDNSGGGLNNEVSFTLNDGLNVSSASDKSNSYLAVDKVGSYSSSTRDESYGSNASEASECSSLSGSEEETETELLAENSNSLVGHEHKYFSSLRFSTTTSSPVNNTLQSSIQCQSSHDMESNIPENCPKNYVLGHFVQSYCKKKSTSHMFVPLGLEDSNLSYTNRLTAKSWPLVNNTFYDDQGFKHYQGQPQGYTALAATKTNTESINEGVPYFRKMTSAKDCSIEALGKDQLENAFHTADLFTLHPWKDNHSSNFLSKNPMLRKNVFFNPMSKPGQEFSLVYGQSLPCFDFLNVEDPCKVYVEKLAANSRHSLINNGDSSDAAGKSHERRKQDNDGDSIFINNDKMASPFSSLYLKKQGQEALVSKDVYGGRSWESLLSKFSFIEKGSASEQKHSLSAMFDIPLDFIIDKCMLQEILLQYKYVSKLAIKILEGFDLHEHYRVLRRYYFMEIADWADLFIMSLWHHKWRTTEAGQRVSEIQGLLELSVQRSSCERDPNKDRLYVYIKGNAVIPLATSAIGVHSFDFLGLGYHVDWPLSIILTPSALKIYSDIFSFLIQVKLAIFALSDVWRSLKDLMHFSGKNSHSAEHETEVGQINMLIRMRQQVNHFISTLQQYVQSQLSHISWCRFLHNLKYKVKDMMDLESVHMEYLTDSLHICFLSDETRPVASIIESILQCALNFRACLTTSIWDVGLDEGGLRGKLSRINISQVLAIKQKFDKNLKELHLCYHKSPKHGEFGLYCFWGHLNYNEYYTDNEMNLYAF